MVPTGQADAATGTARQFRFLIAAYVSFAFILTWTYYATHLGVLDEWRRWHEALLNGTAQDSNQFRVLAYWLPELVHRHLHVPIVESYLTIRFFFTLATLSLFHAFMLKWFTNERAFLGTTLFAAVMPATYLLYLQEADIVVLPLFLLAFWFARERKFWPFAATIVIGTFAKETILFAVPLWLLVRWRDGRNRALIESAALGLAWWGIYFWLTRMPMYHGQAIPLWQLPHTFGLLRDLVRYHPLTNIAWLPLALFGPFWIVAFSGRHHLAGFLRHVPAYAAVFIGLNLVLGWPEEARLLLPIGFLLIPAGISVLFRDR